MHSNMELPLAAWNLKILRRISKIFQQVKMLLLIWLDFQLKAIFQVAPFPCIHLLGIKLPFELLEYIHKLRDERKTSSTRYLTMLDAATFVSHSKLDLSKWSADFVVLSFYKMFGYPTGIGALLMRKGNSSLSH